MDRGRYSLILSSFLPTEISGGGSDDGICVICIVIPIAIILAIILAVAVAIAVYAYYRWKHAPPTNLKEKDAEGING